MQLIVFKQALVTADREVRVVRSPLDAIDAGILRIKARHFDALQQLKDSRLNIDLVECHSLPDADGEEVKSISAADEICHVVASRLLVDFLA